MLILWLQYLLSHCAKHLLNVNFLSCGGGGDKYILKLIGCYEQQHQLRSGSDTLLIPLIVCLHVSMVTGDIQMSRTPPVISFPAPKIRLLCLVIFQCINGWKRTCHDSSFPKHHSQCTRCCHCYDLASYIH